MRISHPGNATIVNGKNNGRLRIMNQRKVATVDSWRRAHLAQSTNWVFTKMQRYFYSQFIRRTMASQAPEGNVLPLVVRRGDLEYQIVLRGLAYVITTNSLMHIGSTNIVVERTYNKASICYRHVDDVINYVEYKICRKYVDMDDPLDGTVQIGFIGAQHHDSWIYPNCSIQHRPEEEVEGHPVFIFKQQLRHDLRHSLRSLGKAFIF
jgi:hypothetical protein